MSKPNTILALTLSVRGVIPLRCKQVHKDRNRYNRKSKHRKGWGE